MKHFQKIILSIIGVIILTGSIAFAESGYFIFGFLMVALTFVACGIVACLFDRVDTYEKLTEAYKGAEEIYKDSLKTEREYMEKLNEIIRDTLEQMERMNGAQMELNEFLQKNLAVRRIDNLAILSGYKAIQSKIGRSMKTNARKR